MIPLTALWLPVLLSAVIVFFASFIMHMVLAYHKSDYRRLPDEDRVTDALRDAGVTRGPAYFFPYFSFKEMKSAPVIEKMKRGPVGLLTVLPNGPPAMGKNLVQWFLYCVVISIFAAYLSGRTLAPGTAFLQVFRVVGIAALLGCTVRRARTLRWEAASLFVGLGSRRLGFGENRGRLPTLLPTPRNRFGAVEAG